MQTTVLMHIIALYQLDLIERISPGGPKRSPHDCIILRRKLTSVDLRSFAVSSRAVLV